MTIKTIVKTICNIFIAIITTLCFVYLMFLVIIFIASGVNMMMNNPTMNKTKIENQIINIKTNLDREQTREVVLAGLKVVYGIDVPTSATVKIEHYGTSIEYTELRAKQLESSSPYPGHKKDQ